MRYMFRLKYPIGKRLKKGVGYYESDIVDFPNPIVPGHPISLFGNVYDTKKEAMPIFHDNEYFTLIELNGRGPCCKGKTLNEILDLVGLDFEKLKHMPITNRVGKLDFIKQDLAKLESTSK